jgi:NADPH-dependent curcumin reductase CurA
MTGISQARAVRLTTMPAGQPQRGDFSIADMPVPAPGPGELTIRALWVSVDPYLMMPIRAGKFEDGRIRSRIIARVEQSRAPGFSEGDLVLGFARWQQHDCVKATEMRRLQPRAPLPAYLGIAGHSGFTAMLGVRLLAPQPGQTVTVSSAAGIVGSIACQLATASGARVVAIAGGAKAERIAALYGLAAGVDHGTDDFASRLAAAAPNGIDRHFENVGARILDPVLGLANQAARVALCGLIQHYGDDAPVCLANFRKILTSGVAITPFSIYQHEDEYPQALAVLEEMVLDGRLHAPEQVHLGLEAIPDAFLAMLAGDGIGKHVVRLAD